MCELSSLFTTQLFYFLITMHTINALSLPRMSYLYLFIRLASPVKQSHMCHFSRVNCKKKKKKSMQSHTPSLVVLKVIRGKLCYKLTSSRNAYMYKKVIDNTRL